MAMGSTGGLLHLFPMGIGCPVPPELQGLEYHSVIMELDDKVPLSRRMCMSKDTGVSHCPKTISVRICRLSLPLISGAGTGGAQLRHLPHQQGQALPIGGQAPGGEGGSGLHQRGSGPDHRQGLLHRPLLAP